MAFEDHRSPAIERRQLSGWGRTPAASSDVAVPRGAEDIVGLML